MWQHFATMMHPEPVFSLAKGCLGHRSNHRLPFPVDTDVGVKLDQAFLPKLVEQPSLAPGLETVMHSAACSHTSGQGLPLANCPQHIEDRIHRLAGWYPGPPTFRVWPLLGQERLDALPQFVWDAPLFVNRCVLC